MTARSIAERGGCGTFVAGGDVEKGAQAVVYDLVLLAACCDNVVELWISRVSMSSLAGGCRLEVVVLVTVMV